MRRYRRPLGILLFCICCVLFMDRAGAWWREKFERQPRPASEAECATVLGAIELRGGVK